MKAIEIIPGPLNGTISIPPSKSLCHRAIIASSLARGESIINNVVISDDIAATIQGVQALGVKINHADNNLVIKGGLFNQNECIIVDCKESGSTLRFLMPIGLLTNNSISYVGKGNLRNRPLDPYIQIFKEQSIYHSNNALPMEVRGTLKPGIFNIHGKISSQFITGLMMALPLLENDSVIHIIENLESKAYIDLTISVLNSFGIKIENNCYRNFIIKGRQQYIPTQYTVESDFSQAAFWLTAGSMSGNITFNNLNQYSLQGDKRILDILKTSGSKICYDNNTLNVSSSYMSAFNADVSECPDLAPILTVLAALSHGTSRITGAARLRIKECDRLKAITLEMNKLGAKIIEHKESLTIEGVDFLHGGIVDSWGDHRIAMALAIASVRCINPVVLTNYGAVDKSYPKFFSDFITLGGNVYERDLG